MAGPLTCPKCGGTDIEEKGFAVVWCETCGHAWPPSLPQATGPTDPRSLARLRVAIANNDAPNISALEDLRHLLADRDHWKAEAERWRARCQVMRDDTKQVGITREKMAAWLVARGWQPSPREGTERFFRAERDPCMSRRLTMWRASPPDGRGISIPDDDDAWEDLATAIRSAAYHFDSDPWAVLDSVAAMEVE